MSDTNEQKLVYTYEKSGLAQYSSEEGFTLTAETLNQLTEDERNKLDNTYGTFISLEPDRGTPAVTLKGIVGSFTDFQIANSALYGILADSLSLDYYGQIQADRVYLTFDNILARDFVVGMTSQGSVFDIQNSTLTFNKVKFPEQTKSTEIKGVVFDSMSSGYAKISASEVSITDSEATQAKAFFLYLAPSNEVLRNTVNVTNSQIKTIEGFSITGSALDLQTNSMNVQGGNYQSLTAVNLSYIGQNAEAVKILNNQLNIAGLEDGQAEVVGVRLSGSSLTGAEITGNCVSLTDSNIASLHVISGTSDFYKGNTAKFSGSNTINGELGGFDRMEFSVSAKNETEAVLTLNSKDGYSFDKQTLSVAKGTDVQEGTEYKLVSVNGSVAQFTNTTVESEATFVNSTWNLNDFTLADGETLSVRWGESTQPEAPEPGTPDTPVLDPDNPDHQVATDNSKTLSESRLGTVAFINRGAEFIADEGMAAMVSSSKLSDRFAFGTAHGGSTNYQTGSRVDVDGYTLAAGAGLKINPDWIVGAFVEAGWAESDSHVHKAKGEGEHEYYGVGLATRYALNDAWYVDGSLRAGQSSTEFKGMYASDSAKYDSDAFYVTAHLGTGYIFNLTESVTLDMYGRYLVTYLDSDDVKLHNRYNDKLEMDSTTAHAVRIGARMTGSFCPYAGWKLGLAYEHVFDGDAESAVNSLNLEVPSLEGESGIMELGVNMKPAVNSPWSMDLGVKGYAGDREGVTGNMVIRYAF